MTPKLIYDIRDTEGINADRIESINADRIK